MADNISTGILSGLYEKVYNPDVLSCLANLSNDEVFTPPEIVNKMLDMLPQELFSSPDTKFLLSLIHIPSPRDYAASRMPSSA